MNICVARNAEARTNAAISRITTALDTAKDEIIVFSRNRFSAEEKSTIKKGKYKLDNKLVYNYEIQLKEKTGKKAANFFQLLHFQFITFRWFYKNQKKYDMIHAFDLDVGLPVLISSKLTGKKYNYHIADFYVDSRKGIPKFLKPFIKKLEHIVINNAENTIVCTEERINQIAGSSPRNVEVIHNTPSVSEEMIKHLPTSSENKDYISLTYVGNLNKIRFIQDAIEVIKKYPQIRLNIAGMGMLKEYVEKVSEKYENIHYYGVIDYKEALTLNSQTDIMFAIYDPKIPNHRYSAPNKVYEAMILGKPIIVARNTGIDAIVNENKMGVVIDYNQENFEQVLLRILDGSISYRELGYNAKKAYPNYSWEEMEERIIKLYHP